MMVKVGEEILFLYLVLKLQKDLQKYFFCQYDLKHLSLIIVALLRASTMEHKMYLYKSNSSIIIRNI